MVGCLVLCSSVFGTDLTNPGVVARLPSTTSISIAIDTRGFVWGYDTVETNYKHGMAELSDTTGATAVVFDIGGAYYACSGTSLDWVSVPSNPTITLDGACLDLAADSSSVYALVGLAAVAKYTIATQALAAQLQILPASSIAVVASRMYILYEDTVSIVALTDLITPIATFNVTDAAGIVSYNGAVCAWSTTGACDCYSVTTHSIQVVTAGAAQIYYSVAVLIVVVLFVQLV